MVIVNKTYIGHNYDPVLGWVSLNKQSKKRILSARAQAGDRICRKYRVSEFVFRRDKNYDLWWRGWLLLFMDTIDVYCSTWFFSVNFCLITNRVSN